MKQEYTSSKISQKPEQQSVLLRVKSDLASGRNCKSHNALYEAMWSTLHTTFKITYQMQFIEQILL